MNPKLLTNEALLAAILSGHMQQRNLAYSQLYQDQTVRNKLRSWGPVYGIDDSGLEDALQESILRLDSMILDGKFRAESSVPTFLLSIVRNLLREKARSKGNVQYAEDVGNNLGASESEYPDGHIFIQEATEAEQKRDQILRALLEQLKDNCKSLLASFYYLEKSLAQIATELGLANANQAKKAAFRCRQQLRRLIENQPGLENYLKLTL